MDKTIFFKLAKEAAAEVKDIRRKLHTCPEVAFKEFKTAEIIRSYLKKLPVEILNPYIETDTVGIIRGKASGDSKTVLLRADIDALSLEDKSGKPWSSLEKGKSHSCGHDGHTAILLGSVKLLTQLTDKFSGNVKFLFQPGEEGGAGGKHLVEKGILEDEPSVDEVYGLHGWSGIPEGVFETSSGVLMAAVADFELEVRGKGGHAAMPHLLTDPILCSAQIISSLQTIVSRNTNPLDSAVISVSSIKGGDANNVIPDCVKMTGTVRFLKKEQEDFLREKIDFVIKGCCAATGCKYEFNYMPSYIPLVNNREKVLSLGTAIKAVLGQESWFDNGAISMGGEDFSFFLDKKPGVFFWLGLGQKQPALHNSAFDFNDNVLERGILGICIAALSSLGCEFIASTAKHYN